VIVKPFSSTCAAAAAIALALVSTSPLGAQDGAAAPSSPVEQGAPKVQYSPEDDLDCALVLSLVLGIRSATMQPDEKSGVIAGVAHFLGRYEAATGGDFRAAMPDRYPTFIKSDIAAIAKQCGARLSDFGERTKQAGAAVSALEKAPPEDSDK